MKLNRFLTSGHDFFIQVQKVQFYKFPSVLKNFVDFLNYNVKIMHDPII